MEPSRDCLCASPLLSHSSPSMSENRHQILTSKDQTNKDPWKLFISKNHTFTKNTGLSLFSALSHLNSPWTATLRPFAHQSFPQIQPTGLGPDWSTTSTTRSTAMPGIFSAQSWQTFSKPGKSPLVSPLVGTLAMVEPKPSCMYIQPRALLLCGHSTPIW